MKRKQSDPKEIVDDVMQRRFRLKGVAWEQIWKHQRFINQAPRHHKEACAKVTASHKRAVTLSRITKT